MFKNCAHAYLRTTSFLYAYFAVLVCKLFTKHSIYTVPNTKWNTFSFAWLLNVLNIYIAVKFFSTIKSNKKLYIFVLSDRFDMELILSNYQKMCLFYCFEIQYCRSLNILPDDLCTFKHLRMLAL